MEERFQYGSQLGTAVHGNAFESLIVLRKHIFLLLPILRRRALCNWLRHSLLSLLLRLGICFHTGGKDVFFGDACPFRDRERGLNRVSCRRETARPPPLPTGECMQLPPDGGVYITRARKTATRPTELRPSLRLSLSTATNFRLEISAGTHVLELLKFGRTFDGKKGKQSLK